MRAALRVPTPEENFHAQWAEMVLRLAPANSAAYDLTIANSLWNQQGVPLLPSYIELMTDCYEAATHAVDFCGDPGGARSTINEWVSRHTKQRIPHLLHPPFPAPTTRLILVNAVYFKGFWARPFEHSETVEAPFFREDDTEVRVPLMHKMSEVGYRRGPNYQVVSLPYLGATLAMLVLLPDRNGSLSELEASLSVPMIQEFSLSMAHTEVELFLPRFKLAWGAVDLVQPLRALGIRSAFTNQADFSGIDGRAPPDKEALSVSNILHKAVLEVNEEGTEAAAATVTAMWLGLADPNVAPPPTFRADHAFLCAIIDTHSGAILFLGRVADPAHEV